MFSHSLYFRCSSVHTSSTPVRIVRLSDVWASTRQRGLRAALGLGSRGIFGRRGRDPIQTLRWTVGCSRAALQPKVWRRGCIQILRRDVAISDMCARTRVRARVSMKRHTIINHVPHTTLGHRQSERGGYWHASVHIGV